MLKLDSSIIIGILSGVITGVVTGLLGICGVNKSIKTTLEISKDSINSQLELQGKDHKRRDIKELKDKLITIYENLLMIERSHDITAIYIESDKDKEANNSKYILLIEKLDHSRALCDLYFSNELSDNFKKLQLGICNYWKSLDDYFRGTDEQKLKFRDKAYEVTREIEHNVSDTKFIIQKMIDKYKIDS
ncbi:hypothetical protein HYE55_08660 [Aggregatibacter actinomycetemcomitans]|uniref:hypothetical protein n=1 Tax=Aggregatibacter actinomycetemcomitans TaxID=714 RepID=UPI00197B0D8F|nr:hypothetical protein [Aggregatibacter actinomycetemcomitans]MBN6082121.1 hypothetical protein [Aggregatibacter actinomycetemcomitans]